MKFNEIMHLSFYTDQMDEMRDFYENKLGLKAKIMKHIKEKKIEVLGLKELKQTLKILLISSLN